jgi:hypothetical protein
VISVANIYKASNKLEGHGAVVLRGGGSKGNANERVEGEKLKYYV